MSTERERPEAKAKAQPEVAELISMENRQGLDGGAQVAQRKRREPVQSS